ncbi:MAG: iron-containing alcohol dehydrogenase [Clostridia bacterium]|nr:iron-containing alcohol dehydrogenase [Clostridia bacterium]MBO5433966.1 iron-containing alcohol dehydrogenase [Clostridia bacterium]MBP3559121.1 iron-containing alcohol dehydrogenase [Clostridia bacterium]
MKFSVNFLDWTPPKLLKGAGAIKELPELVKSQGINNVLVVTDKGLMGLHLLDSLFEGLEKAGVKYSVFDSVQPNPTIYNVEDALKMYKENNCQGIIAFGGGSPMDCAKVTGARVVKPNQSAPDMRGVLKILKKLPPFFAVPTTAGTGSECTIAAVISNPDTHEKNSIMDPVLRPKYAVLDPELTVGLPPHITSTTGMDALTHAVEAFIGKSNTKQTEDDALIATKLVFENIEDAYNDGKNIKARENMLVASYHAGLAFTRAYVGYVHAIAHNLGGMYNIPHGLANAVILPYVLDYFGESAYSRLAILADVAGVSGQAQGEREKAKNFIAAIRDLNAKMGIPDKFDQIKDEDIQLIAERALMEGNPLYPVPKIMDLEDCKAIIKKLQK